MSNADKLETVKVFNPQYLQGATDVQATLTFRTADGEIRSGTSQLGPIHVDSAEELKARVLRYATDYVRMSWVRIEVLVYHGSRSRGDRRWFGVLDMVREVQA